VKPTGTELSPFQQLLLLVGWVVVAAVVIVGFFAALGTVLYLTVRTYERFIAGTPPEHATPPPWDGWPWRRRARPLDEPIARPIASSAGHDLAPLPFGPGLSSAPEASQSLFVGLVTASQEGDVGVYLVNNTALDIGRVVTRTGMFAHLPDALVDSNVETRDHGSLGPFQALLLEESPSWARDFYIWYEFSLSVADSPDAIRGRFAIPKDVWSPAKSLLPLLNREGVRLFDRARSEFAPSTDSDPLGT
jgi:hypothetical protein